MRPRTSSRRCSYVVAIEHPRSDAELTSLAHYLSDLGAAGCDVLVVDDSPQEVFEQHRRVLRWVARHETVRPQHRSAFGTIDLVRVAAERGAEEKLIVSDADVRFTPETIDATIEMLDEHEAVELQEYFDPLPWWAGIDAARMLLRRGIDPDPGDGASFAIHRTVARSLRSLPPATGNDDVKRLVYSGVEIAPAPDVLVRRQPAPLGEWLEARPHRAAASFSTGVKAAFFFSLVPMLVFLALAAGIEVAAGVAGLLAFSSIALASRGRIGAAHVFPLRTVFFAPLWLLERSLSVYIALYDRLTESTELEPASAKAESERSRAASGE